MRHISLTCKNHPHLRWSTKSIAVSDGKYNGLRSIFFKGKVTEPIKFYSDMSGVECEAEPECDCPYGNLIVAPEDEQLERFYKLKLF